MMSLVPHPTGHCKWYYLDGWQLCEDLGKQI